MRLHLYVAAAALLAASLAARADTTSIFNVTGTFDDGSSLSGTVTIDTTTGEITDDGLTISAPFSATFDFGDIYGESCNSAECVFDSDNSDGQFLGLSLATGSLVNYSGGSINNFSFASVGATTTSLTSGSLTLAPAAVTPEPSSFILLGTGLLGAAGVLRRRLA